MTVLAAAGVATTAAGQSAPAHGRPAHRVVIALTDGDAVDLELTLKNLANLRQALAPEPLEAEVVAYGPGIAALQRGSFNTPAVANEEAAGTRFLACATAMGQRRLRPGDMLPGVEQVPSGIAEVVRKEEQGWSYLKAGR